MQTGAIGTGVVTALLLAGAAAAQPARPTAGTAPKNVALVGVTEIGNQKEVWLMDVRTRQRLTVRPGETAFGYQVRKVGADTVVLANGKREYTVRMGDKAVPTLVAPAAVPVVEPNRVPNVRVSETPARQRARTLSGSLTLPPISTPEVPTGEVPVVAGTPGEGGPTFAGTPDPRYPVDPYEGSPYLDYGLDPRLSPYFDAGGYSYPYPGYGLESAVTPYSVSPYPGWGFENPLYPEGTGLPRPFNRIAPWNTPDWNRPGDPRLPYATPAAPRNPQTGRRQGWTGYPTQNTGLRRAPAPNPQTLRRRGQLFGPDLAPSAWPTGPGYTPGYPR